MPLSNLSSLLSYFSHCRLHHTEWHCGLRYNGVKRLIWIVHLFSNYETHSILTWKPCIMDCDGCFIIKQRISLLLLIFFRRARLGCLYLTCLVLPNSDLCDYMAFIRLWIHRCNAISAVFATAYVSATFVEYITVPYPDRSSSYWKMHQYKYCKPQPGEVMARLQQQSVTDAKNTAFHLVIMTKQFSSALDILPIPSTFGVYYDIFWCVLGVISIAYHVCYRLICVWHRCVPLSVS